MCNVHFRNYGVCWFELHDFTSFPTNIQNFSIANNNVDVFQAK